MPLSCDERRGLLWLMYAGIARHWNMGLTLFGRAQRLIGLACNPRVSRLPTVLSGIGLIFILAPGGCRWACGKPL